MMASSTAATNFAPNSTGGSTEQEQKGKAMTEHELRRLEALVGRWQAERQDRVYRLKLKTRFAKTTTLDLITMWATSTNETGKSLTKFEVEALVEAWLRVFGELPPTSKPTTSHEPRESIQD